VLSLTCGIRAQILRMEVKIRAFLAAGMRGGAEMGRNSAIGAPRRSITITSPSAASRTNLEVWMWSSRTEVFLICYIVAQAAAHYEAAFCQENHGSELGWNCNGSPAWIRTTFLTGFSVRRTY